MNTELAIHSLTEQVRLLTERVAKLEDGEPYEFDAIPLQLVPGGLNDAEPEKTKVWPVSDKRTCKHAWSGTPAEGFTCQLCGHHVTSDELDAFSRKQAEPQTLGQAARQGRRTVMEKQDEKSYESQSKRPE